MIITDDKADNGPNFAQIKFYKMKIKKNLFMLLVFMLSIVNFSAAQDNPGCMDEGACNYDPTAVVDDASCFYSQTYYIDADGDGIGTDNTVYYGCDMPLGFAAISGDCDDNNPAITGPPGNPNDWGQGEWNAYVYQGVYFDNYKGYFVRQGDTYNSELDFNAWGTPMSSPGYMGCPVSDDFHSVRYKRQGFPTADFPYAITVPSWDDDVYVYVDGILVWSAGCCAGGLSNNVVWTGDLNENSTVEISFGEYGGASYLAFSVEPQYPLSFNGSTMLYQNACYGFDYYTQVFQDFGVDPSSMTYAISSANQLIDVNNVDIQFFGSDVVFHLTPNQILGEDLLTFVVADSMGFTDTLLVNISLGECPPPLDVFGSTDMYHDACSDFEIFIGINSPLGYVTSDLTFVTTFSDTTFVLSSEPEYVYGWDNGQYSYFYAAGQEGSTVATTVVTDPMGNSDTLVTLLTFGTCYPVLDVDFNLVVIPRPCCRLPMPLIRQEWSSL
jgi:hypothetical protein